MDRLLLAAALTAVIAGLAVVLRRARPPRSVTVASGPEGWALPQVIDREDLGSPDAATVIVVFTSASCHTCARVWEQVQALPRPGVVAREIEYSTARAFHQKYGIEGVPATAFVDASGGVQTWLLGPVTDEQLEQALVVAQDAARGVQVRGLGRPDDPAPG